MRRIQWACVVCVFVLGVSGCGEDISGCHGEYSYGVWCKESGSTATVRPPAAAPSAAPPVRCGRRARRRFSAPFRRFFPPFFGSLEPP